MATNTIILAFFFLQIITISHSFSLSTNSRWIVDDATGNRVKLSCVNLVSHLQPMITEGLEKKPLNFTAKKISELGFNCVRFTWPTYMFTRPDYGNITVSASLDKYNLSTAKEGIARNNPQILTMNVVELHKAVVDELGKNGLMVILDNHVSLPGWCCGDGDGNGFFGDANFDPQEWLRGLAAVATAYKANPAVVGMSLRNEIRGGRQNVDDWYKFMQQGANTVHTQNPNFLVIVSGLSYDTNLGFLKSKPLAVNVGNKLVFEAHWYIFGIPSARWVAQTNNLCAAVTKRAQDNYLFLTAGNNSFPLFLSEFGVDLSGKNEASNRYIGCLLAAVAELDVEWAFWALQGSYILREGKPNLEETYGILDLNWDAPRNPAFLDRLQLISQINQGMSLRNELRGNRQNEADWYKFMQDGANTVHKENPDLLVILSGLNFDTKLGFLKSKPLAVTNHLSNKLVYEAHWYTFGNPADQWVAQTNNLCSTMTKNARDNFFFVTVANNNFPLFLSEFGANLRGDNEADNRYIGCLMAVVAEIDVDWALWTLQGSYMLREGTVDHEEFYGVLDLTWDSPRNPAFLDRLQLMRQINQDYKSNNPTYYYKMFHPLSGQCVQIGGKGIALANCKSATHFDQLQDGGAIKLAGSPTCLGVAGEGAAASVSRDCSSKWKFVSSSGLHLAAQDGKGSYLCLEKNASDSKVVTKKCLCVGDDLGDLSTCNENPQPQWFKLVPANV